MSLQAPLRRKRRHHEPKPSFAKSPVGIAIPIGAFLCLLFGILGVQSYTEDSLIAHLRENGKPVTAKVVHRRYTIEDREYNPGTRPLKRNWRVYFVPKTPLDGELKDLWLNSAKSMVETQWDSSYDRPRPTPDLMWENIESDQYEGLQLGDLLTVYVDGKDARIIFGLK